ncbi:MAG: DUF3027 domain-containing protein [Demequina sp.]|uniref:DUF3027 domain-containing protein n=1 Tax=Demequina sp. TaxID=2050685 RepID=UPI003A8A79E6
MDAVLDSAVDLARESAIEVAEGAEWVGEHLGSHQDEDRLVTHLFGCTMPGYRGWVWSVTLSRAPRLKQARVCEAHLVAADDALLSPPWVPWADRVQPGDIKPGMAVPKIDGDPRLVPGYTVTGDDEADEVAIWEFGLGRERVLGPVGRDEAFERWNQRAQDLHLASTRSATPSGAVGEFVIPLSGAMRLHFGVCANKWCPFDGTVVPVDHECGGQQQAAPDRTNPLWPANDPVFDTEALVEMVLGGPVAVQPETEPESVAEPEAEAASEPEAVAEPEAEAEVGASEPEATVADEPVADQDVADEPEADEPEVTVPSADEDPRTEATAD